MVVARHRMELLTQLVLDTSSPPDRVSPAWDPRFENRAVGLTLLQALLPLRRPGQGELAAAVEPGTLQGILAHLGLVRHLTDDLEGRTALVDVLDLSVTETGSAQLLCYRCKMDALISIAMDPCGAEELVGAGVLGALASAAFLPSPSSVGPRLSTLVWGDWAPPSGFCRRLHALLLPALRLIGCLLHSHEAGGRWPAGLAGRFVERYHKVLHELLSPAWPDDYVQRVLAGPPQWAEEVRLAAEALAAIPAPGPDGAPEPAHAGRIVCGLARRLLEGCVLPVFWRRLESSLSSPGPGPVAGLDLLGALEAVMRYMHSRLGSTPGSAGSGLDCRELLPGGAVPLGRLGGLEAFSVSRESGPAVGALPAALVVEFACQAVEHLCGPTQAGPSSDAFTAGLWGSLASVAADRSGPGRAAAGDSDARLVRAVRHVQLLCMLSLDLIAMSLHACALAGPRPDGSAAGSIWAAARGPTPMAERLWNAARTGCSQRLLLAYHHRLADGDCDGPAGAAEDCHALQDICQILRLHLCPWA